MVEKKKKRGRDEYSASLREKCKLLYFEIGTFPGVRRELKRRGHVDGSIPADSTLKRWMVDEDWRTERARLDLLKEAECASPDELEKLLAEVKAMKTVVKQAIKDLGVAKNPKQNSQLSQHIYAYNQLALTMARVLEIKRKIEKEGRPDTPVEVVFAALRKHRSIGKILEKPETVSELRELVAEEMLAYQRETMGIAQEG